MLLILSLFVSVAQAQTNDHWMKSAYEFCMRDLGDASDFERMKCIKATEGHLHDVDAINFCKNRQYTNERIECIASLADLKFRGIAVDHCEYNRETFTSQLACLKYVAGKDFELDDLDSCRAFRLDQYRQTCLEKLQYKPLNR